MKTGRLLTTAILLVAGLLIGVFSWQVTLAAGPSTKGQCPLQKKADKDLKAAASNAQHALQKITKGDFEGAQKSLDQANKDFGQYTKDEGKVIERDVRKNVEEMQQNWDQTTKNIQEAIDRGWKNTMDAIAKLESEAGPTILKIFQGH